MGHVVPWGLSVLLTGTGASLSSQLHWDFYKASEIAQVNSGRRYCEYTYLGYVRSKVCGLETWLADQAPGDLI